MTGRTLAVFPGARLMYAGDLTQVVELDGTRVTVRNHRTGEFTAVRLGELVALPGPRRSPASVSTARPAWCWPGCPPGSGPG